MPEQWDVWSVLGTFLVVFGGAIAAVLPKLVKLLFKWLDAKIENEIVSGMLRRAGPIVADVTEDVFQSFIKPLREKGKADKATMAEAKKVAVAEMKKHLGVKGVQDLAKVVGAEGVDKWLGGLVEDQVKSAKVRGKAGQLPAVESAAVDPLPQ